MPSFSRFTFVLCGLSLFFTASVGQAYDLFHIPVPEECNSNYVTAKAIDTRGGVLVSCSVHDNAESFSAISRWSAESGHTTYPGYEIDKRTHIFEATFDRNARLYDDGSIKALVYMTVEDDYGYGLEPYYLTIQDGVETIQSRQTVFAPAEFNVQDPDQPLKFAFMGPDGGLIGQAIEVGSGTTMHYFHYLNGELNYLRSFFTGSGNRTFPYLHPEEGKVHFRIAIVSSTKNPRKHAGGRLCDDESCSKLEAVYHSGTPHDMNGNDIIVGRLSREVEGRLRSQAAAWYKRGKKYKYTFLPTKKRFKSYNSDATSINSSDAIVGLASYRLIVVWKRVGPRRKPRWRVKNISKQIREFLDLPKKVIFFREARINDCGDIIVNYDHRIEEENSDEYVNKVVFLRNDDPNCEREVPHG